MLRIFAVVLGVLAATTVFAQSRCDCDEIVGQCQATIKEVPKNSSGAHFKLQANTEQCAIVEWSVDGDRGMTTIWDDGEEVTRVSPRKPGGAMKVHSCRVCKDSLHSRQPPAASGATCKQYEFTDTSGKRPIQITEERMRQMLETSGAKSESEMRQVMLDAINKQYQAYLQMDKVGADIFREDSMNKMPGALQQMRPLLNCVLDSMY